MMWQDIVISIANVLFSYSLIIQVYHGFKKRKGFLTLQTSLLTSIGIFAMGVATFSLNLYVSGIVLLFNGTLWLILFLQRLMYQPA